jgi:hypothetical protein
MCSQKASQRKKGTLKRISLPIWRCLHEVFAWGVSKLIGSSFKYYLVFHLVCTAVSIESHRWVLCGRIQQHIFSQCSNMPNWMNHFFAVLSCSSPSLWCNRIVCVELLYKLLIPYVLFSCNLCDSFREMTMSSGWCIKIAWVEWRHISSLVVWQFPCNSNFEDFLADGCEDSPWMWRHITSAVSEAVCQTEWSICFSYIVTLPIRLMGYIGEPTYQNKS